MSDRRPNIPVPDELAFVRAQIRVLEDREAELRRLLLTNPDLREGASYLAEIKVTKRQTTDWKEIRALHPDLVAEHTHAFDVTSVVLLGVTEDGELISARKMRAIGDSQ